MDVFTALGGGFGVALQPGNLLLAFIGCILGTAIGVLPGIGPLNAIALLLPFCLADHPCCPMCPPPPRRACRR